MSLNRRLALRLSILGGLAAGLLATPPGIAGAETLLRMEGFPAGSTSGQINVAFAQASKKHADITIQVSVGKAAPKMVVDAATGKTDLMGLPPLVAAFMKTKTGMFKDVEQAPEMLSRVRSVLNYPIGQFHIIASEDSGITDLSQIAGKKVFLGPPAGAATNVAKQMIAAASGLAPDKDFEVMPFDWASSTTAFLDRQIDVMIAPAQIPSALVEQFAQIGKIRFLGVSDAAWESDAVKKVLAIPSVSTGEIPAGIYANQVNEGPVRTIAAWTGMGAAASLDADLMYRMTKAFWDNIDETRASVPWLSDLTPQTALTEMNVPLHAGVYRYYRENGIEVPAELVPPEAE